MLVGGGKEAKAGPNTVSPNQKLTKKKFVEHVSYSSWRVRDATIGDSFAVLVGECAKAPSNRMGSSQPQSVAYCFQLYCGVNAVLTGCYFVPQRGCFMGYRQIFKIKNSLVTLLGLKKAMVILFSLFFSLSLHLIAPSYLALLRNCGFFFLFSAGRWQPALRRTPSCTSRTTTSLRTTRAQRICYGTLRKVRIDAQEPHPPPSPLLLP